jgi:hypothetical protein
MQAGSGSIFQPELATGPSLVVELISSHARIDGTTIVVDHSDHTVG